MTTTFAFARDLDDEPPPVTLDDDMIPFNKYDGRLT